MSAEHKAEDIIVSPNFPPIPVRSFDYAAYRRSYEGGDPIGYGETPEAAVADLRVQEADAEADL
jgi:hypothetical protein